MAAKRKQTRSSSSASARGGKRKSSARSKNARSASGRSGSGARQSAGGTRQMDAIKLLKQDHREVEALLKEFEKARSPRKAQIAEEICRMLTVHATIEEEIFYPAAREALKEEDLVEEAEVEHQSAKDLIAQIQGSTPDDDKFEARVTVLGEYVRHHVREEEKEMFTQLQKRKIDLQALGEQLMERKQQLMGMAEGDEMMDDETATAGGRGRGNGSRASREESATMNAQSESGSRRR
jgi:hemerythrin superfamily protein